MSKPGLTAGEQAASEAANLPVIEGIQTTPLPPLGRCTVERTQAFKVSLD